MKHSILRIFGLWLCMTAWATAAVVTSERACAVAEAFARQNALLANELQSVSTVEALGGVWVVSFLPAGYVVIDGEDTRPPVLAFATHAFPQPVPTALADILFRTPLLTSSDLLTTPTLLTTTSLAATTTTTTETPHADWATLLPTTTRYTLLTATSDTITLPVAYKWEVDTFAPYHWSQNLPYNLYAPGISAENTAKKVVQNSLGGNYGTRSAIGCVATSLSQVGNWFAWPAAWRGVKTIEQAKGELPQDGTVPDLSTIDIATCQTAAPGKPYDWDLFANCYQPTSNDPVASEVGRYLQHWATLVEVGYAMDGSGGTEAAVAAADRWLNMGFKNLSKRTMDAFEFTFDETAQCYAAKLTSTLTTDETTAIYTDIKKGVATLGVPVSIAIEDHQIVCFGWAQNSDALLANECYAEVNYGWAGDSDGWLRVQKTSDSTGVGDICIRETALMVPLQCGQLRPLPGHWPTATDLPITWDESPYYQQNNATRTLRCLTFDTTDTITRTASLADAAASDANWTYTEILGLCIDRLPLLASAVVFPELFHGAKTLEIALSRATWIHPLTAQPAYLTDETGRALIVYLVQPQTGVKQALCDANGVSLLRLQPDEVEGTCRLEIPDEWQTETFQIVIQTADPDDEKGFPIPYDGIAYDIHGVQVTETAPVAETDYAFDTTRPTTPSRTLQSYTGTLPADYLPETGEAWLALTIGTPQTNKDAMWSCITIDKTLTETPTRFTLTLPERVALADATIEIPVTIEGLTADSIAQLTVESYVSDGFWVTAEHRQGNAVTLQTQTTEEGTAYSLVFTGDPTFLSVENDAAVGHDTILTVQATDPTSGTIVSTHTRLTYGAPSLPPYTAPTTDAVTAEWDPNELDNILYCARIYHVTDKTSALSLIETATLLHYSSSDMFYDLYSGTTPFFAKFKPTLTLSFLPEQCLRVDLEDGVSDAEVLASRDLSFSVYAGETLSTLEKTDLTPSWDPTLKGYQLTPSPLQRFFKVSLEP